MLTREGNRVQARIKDKKTLRRTKKNNEKESTLRKFRKFILQDVVRAIKEIQPAGCCPANQSNEDHAPLKRVSYFRKLRTRPTDSDNTGSRDESTEKQGFATVIKYADDILTSRLPMQDK
ncbi:hypothetical protein CEXT_422281 [Caerostris extrusa]|uniref:Uncharacterized protein n=1 Tax=Caerostris extrusa TaxID=172846 RepID=A0AAV4U9H2_CAEEX|nr:hypothetical protein CEXT_422281 [Caerostris extrusa]